VSFVIYPYRDSNRPLFESIMPVILTITTIVFSIMYFKKISTNYLHEGILAGSTWFVVSLLIDLIMFLPDSPMQMPFADYMMDIGLTYLIIPIVVTGIGYIIEGR